MIVRHLAFAAENNEERDHARNDEDGIASALVGVRSLSLQLPRKALLHIARDFLGSFLLPLAACGILSGPCCRVQLIRRIPTNILNTRRGIWMEKEGPRSNLPYYRTWGTLRSLVLT